MDGTAVFAAMAVALYVAHHVGDYWVQTDHQAKHKGAAGREGVKACTAHVVTYLATQIMCVSLVCAVTGVAVSPLGLGSALLVSGGTHYLADRREYGIMLKLARMLPGKSAFLKLGVPRDAYIQVASGQDVGRRPLDNPSLGTGAWALDQSWHIFWGVFVAALLLAGL